LPGVSPEDAERLLIRPLETELKSIEGIKRIDSVAATNVAYIILEFQPSQDLDQAIADVLEKVDRARAEFPQEAQEPIVEEVTISALPIITVNLWGDVPERELQLRAKELQRRLESLPQVLNANISGERIDVLEAIIDPSKMDSLGITFDEIAGTVSRNNALIAAGAVETDTGKFNVKLPGLIEKPIDLADLVVRRGENNSIVRMFDISTVRRGYKDIENIARFNARSSVSLEVSKRQGVNILDTVALVEKTVNEIAASPNWPETVNITYSQSRATYINDMMRELSASIVNAVILVFIVCIAALGWRSALFVGWAIPSSFLIAFFLFYVQGETINMMILFGLILSVGVLVDSAIVIVEYADRKMDEGLARQAAFQMAGERMFWPIISSTATTLAAFIPLLFWESITGKFMAYFPRTMIYVLTASMLMALVFLPTLGAKIGFKPKRNENSNAALLSAAEGDPSKVRGFTGLYVRLIRQLIRVPLLVLAGLAVLGFVIIASFEASLKGSPPKPIEFFTQTPSDQLFVLARTRGNTTPQQSLEIAKELEQRILKINGVASIYTVAGPGAAGSGSAGAAFNGPSNVPIDSTVRIYTELHPFNKRRSVAEIIEDDIEDTLPLPGIDWEIVVDRSEAGRLGLDIGRIGAAIQFITEGALVGQFRPLDVEEEVDIRIRYPKDARDLNQLDTLRIQTPQGAIPLSSVIKRVPRARQM